MSEIIIEKIPKMASWVRDITAGQIKLGLLTEDHFDSLNTTVSRQNKIFFLEEYNLWIKRWTNKYQDRVAIMGLTRDEFEAAECDITLWDVYKKRLPTNFFSKYEYWKRGTWHDCPQ